MADPNDLHHRTEHYEDTTDPKNPPNSVTNRQVRSTAVRTYVGPIVALFVVAGLALIYWANRDSVSGRSPADQEVSADAVGTAGSGHAQTPGGFDPQGQPGSTRDEIERRSGGDTAAGGELSTPARQEGQAITELGAIQRDGEPVIGRVVELRDLDVAEVSGETFWVRDGDVRALVTAPAGATIPRSGARVDLSGVTERDDDQGVRIRASRITVR